jgi:hypothetical protein
MTGLHLIVFAKAPVAGQAKTRLMPALGAAGAAALAERLLERAVDACLAAREAAPLAATEVGNERRAGPTVTVELCTTPDTAHAAFQRLAHKPGLQLSTQGEGDLGARMDRALTRALATAQAALLIGTDAPALDAAMLLQAAQALAQHDAVFVPALDGGYALVGLRQPVPLLFSQMAWSTPQVMAHTRERARQAGLRWAELQAVADVDLPADLVHLPPGWLPAEPRP